MNEKTFLNYFLVRIARESCIYVSIINSIDLSVLIAFLAFLEFLSPAAQLFGGEQW